MQQIKNIIKKGIKEMFVKTPFVFEEYGYMPGHFYSTIPLIDDVEKNKKKIFENEEIKDIDLRLEEQFKFVQQLQKYHSLFPYKLTEAEEKSNGQQGNLFRYNPIDAFYRYSDAIFLFGMMMHFKPGKIIEIGSGHSSAIMLDTNELFFQNAIHLTFIEPFPEERLYKVLRENDQRCSTVIKSMVQEKEATFFSSLEKNDILFVDSTHISKVGSDVNHIIFNVLPALKPGVFIHFHDIFYPFELPYHWVHDRKWFFNEIYLLRAFLMNNPNYEIVLFNSLLQKKYKHWFEDQMPNCLLGSENTGSIWIRKIK